MNTQNHPSDFPNTSENPRDRMRSELRGAMSQAVIPMLRPLLGGFYAASRKIAGDQMIEIKKHFDEQAHEFQKHSDEIFQSLYSRMNQTEQAVGRLSDQIGSQNQTLLDSLSAKVSVTRDGDCWYPQAGANTNIVQSTSPQPTPVQLATDQVDSIHTDSVQVSVLKPKPKPKPKSSGIMKNAKKDISAHQNRTRGSRIQPSRACKPDV